MQCSAMHCNAIYCYTILCNALQCNVVQCIASHCIALHYIAIHYIALQNNALYCIALRAWGTTDIKCEITVVSLCRNVAGNEGPPHICMLDEYVEPPLPCFPSPLFQSLPIPSSTPSLFCPSLLFLVSPPPFFCPPPTHRVQELTDALQQADTARKDAAAGATRLTDRCP